MQEKISPNTLITVAIFLTSSGPTSGDEVYPKYMSTQFPWKVDSVTELFSVSNSLKGPPIAGLLTLFLS